MQCEIWPVNEVRFRVVLFPEDERDQRILQQMNDTKVFLSTEMKEGKFIDAIIYLTEGKLNTEKIRVF